MEPIRLENDSGLALITLNDSSNGNTLTAHSLTALAQALTDAVHDDSVRAILLRSDGPAFCTGMSLSDAGAKPLGTGEFGNTISLYCECLLKIYRAPKPVVCCITGDVKAGGVGLVSACDIVVASPGATFQLSEIFLGMIPANVLPFLFSLRLAPQTVRYLVLTGKKLSAQEALAIQLVNEVVPAETLERDLRALIKGLFRASPKAVARAKQFTGMLYGEKMDPSIELAKNSFTEMMREPEITKAISDFNDGYSPSWFSPFSPKNSLLCKGAV
jgi:methylglutaconyl-CoA hydratase/polyketide biosynthesis enoyl-CoA hydratase PksH